MPNPLRSTMTDLIAEVRDLINDNGTSQHFTDLQIQDELDRNRDDINYEEIAVKASLDSTGHVSWLEYYAPCTDWEQDAKIYGRYNNTSFYDLSTVPGLITSTDYLVGHWVLSASTIPPMYLVGKTYDVNFAASKLAAKWASTVVLDFDASQMGTVAYRSQKYKLLMDLSNQLAARRRPRWIEMARRDVTPHWGQGEPQGQPVR